ncbi:MAG: tRNA pseudouridine(55) synthase TruB [Sandaracinobacter sp.]
MHGWLVVDKPVGPTSAQVVGKLKWALRQGGHGKVKIGHGGTLDPLASGVLPIALGEATKLTGHLLNGPKAYRFTIRFGTATTTDDAEGAVVAESRIRPDPDAIRAVLPRFTGPIRQRPPAYSALKIDGERAYALARAGGAPELAERDLLIHELTLQETTAETATLDVRCSKGTYVRSLARDIAGALGTVGHVALLRRTAAGPFTLDQAMSLDKWVELVHGPAPEQAFLPLTAGLDDIPALAVEPHEAAVLKQGKRLMGARVKPGQYLATLGSVPVAMVVVSEQDVTVLRGFNLT